MQSFIWRHIRLQVPDEWEMLLFSKAMAKGRCTFADRYQHRLQLSWLVVEGKPDLERMASDYRAQLEADETASEIRSTTSGGWRGVSARTGEVTASRYAGYFAGERCLVEMVFLWPEARDARLEQQVLNSMREEPADAMGFRRWQAFGMDMRVTDGLQLRVCTALPASVNMVFGDLVNGQREERFERLGMVEHWLKASVVAWLRAHVPSGIAVREQSEVTADGHVVARLTGRRAREGWRRGFGRRLAFEARAWICPADGRLYCQMLTGSVKTPLGSKGRLRCCEEMEAV